MVKYTLVYGTRSPLALADGWFTEYEVEYYDECNNTNMFIMAFKTFELAKELSDKLGYICVQSYNHGVRELY